ncbi:MAG: YggS family pyridoxal phosphate-dependent enzyme [Maribacter sp.]|nr:YggS family pyridoxal phosphate-dependent enzyme [Maribacter sp.]
MSITENLLYIKKTMPEGVTLVVVTKTKPITAIMEAYNAGHRIFGENKIQEMTEKMEKLPKDVQWHMIGHVQRNKVKYMAAYVTLIHGVDTLKLLQEIDRQAKNYQRKINCLLQVHIAEEETKFGMDHRELFELVASGKLDKLTNTNVIGLMGMATYTENKEQIRREFKHLKQLFDTMKTRIPGISVLSMGMSADYSIAIEEGSTMVRIGSAIFGARN